MLTTHSLAQSVNVMLLFIICQFSNRVSLSMMAQAQESTTIPAHEAVNVETAQIETYDAKQYARPPERYTHLMYDQSVVKEVSRGLEPQRVIQRLPEGRRPFRQLVVRRAGARQPAWGKSYATFRPGERAVVSGNSVLLKHSLLGTETILIHGAETSSVPFTRGLIRIAVSPNGKLLVAAIFKEGDYKLSDNPRFDIHLVDLSGNAIESRVIGEGWHGDSIMGSAFLPTAIAPPIFWADDATLLIATHGPQTAGRGWVEIDAGRDLNAAETAKLGDDILVRGGEVLTPTHDLLRINVNDGAAQKVCDLKLGENFMTSQATGTDFWRRSDGEIMLRSRGEDVRIDLTNREAILDRRLSPSYELRGDRYCPSLWFGDKQIAEVLYYHNVGISPDGRSVAWYARTHSHDTTNLGNTSQYPTTLWFHAAGTGKVQLATGQFASSESWQKFDNPVVNPRFLWLTDEELQAAASQNESDVDK